MEVIEHEPHFWFLLEEAGELYLDVNCQLSAVGFSVIVRLTEYEAQAYRSEGRDSVVRLAEDVEQHPLTAYRERDLSSEVGPAVHDAVMRWRGAS